MPGGGKVQADLQVMRTVSTSFATTYEQLSSTINLLRNEVAEALGGWQGMASGAFSNVFGDVDAAWTNLNVVLDQIAGNIGTSGKSYGISDSQSATGISQGVEVTAISLGLSPSGA